MGFRCYIVHVSTLNRSFVDSRFLFVARYRRKQEKSFLTSQMGKRWLGVDLSHMFVRRLENRFIFIRSQKNRILHTVIQNEAEQRSTWVYCFVQRSCQWLLPRLNEPRHLCLSVLTTWFSLDYLCGVSRKWTENDVIDILFPTPLHRWLYSESAWGKTCWTSQDNG